MAASALPPAAPPVDVDWRRHLRRAYWIVVIVFVVFGGWSAVARLDGGVVAPGAIAVEGNRKTIQHLEGGIVEEILVREGSAVQQGDLLLRLSETRPLATVEAARKQLAALLATEARLHAQRDNKPAIIFPDEVLRQQADPLVAASMRENVQQFAARRTSLMRGLEVLDAQLSQIEKDITQAQDDERSALTRLQSIDRELPGLQSLMSRGLTTMQRVTMLERERVLTVASLDKSSNDLMRSRDRVTEVKARRSQLEQEYRQEAAALVPDLRRAINDLLQQLKVAEDTLVRLEIRAPVSGTVHQLRIFTQGGVLRAGDPVLDIVPQDADLIVRARISPIDVDRIHIGQSVEIRLPQFQRFQSEVIRGSVRTVSRDALIDEATRAPYFAADILVNVETVPEHLRNRLVAGMVADIIVLTAERTAFSYLVSPLLNRMALGLRER